MPVPTTGAAVERSANANARKTIHELARYLTRPLYSFSPPCQDQRCCETLAVCWCHREGQKKSHYRCGLAVSFLLPVNRMDPAKLRAAIAEYNDNLAKKSDPKFGRRFDKAAKPIGSGPYYVSRMSPKVHHCMGGVATAVNTAVLDVMTDAPIPGLFAAGEFVGGIHGAVRIGACAVMDCLVNGREAGMEAAKSPVWA